MVFKAFPIPSLVIVCHFGFFDRIVVDSGPCLPCPSAKLTFVILLRKASLFIEFFLFEYVPGLLRATSGLLISSTIMRATTHQTFPSYSEDLLFSFSSLLVGIKCGRGSFVGSFPFRFIYKQYLNHSVAAVFAS